MRDPNPSAKRRGIPVALGAALALLALGLATATTLLINGQRLPGFNGNAASVAATISRRLSHIPQTPPSSAPPPAHTFSLQQNAIVETATPCPAITLPPAVLQPSPGHVTTPTATPTATATTPTATVTTPTAPVATPTRVALPLCGDGQSPAPRCFTRLPVANPTLDEVRQSLYNAAVHYSMPFSVLEAIAWQESGWQENVVACDGGVGVMQIMPDTQTWLNNANGTNFTSYDLTGNINLGVTLLQWLYNYYVPFCDQGLPAGQVCDWATVWPGATDGATVRDIVVSAYNEGIGTMANYGIINWRYVSSVVDLWSQFLAAE